jgi:hypothetical protein
VASAHHPRRSGVTSSTGATGAQAANPSLGATTGPSGTAAPSSGTGPGGTLPGGSTAAGNAIQCDRTSSDRGVTPSQITIGVILVDLGALNSLLGIASFQDEEKAYNGIFDYYNKQGGANCRKLVPKYYGDNVLDASGEQALCLQMAQDAVFAVLNNLYNPQEFNCLAQRHVPNIFYTSPHTPAMHQYSPDVLSVATDYDRLIKDYVFGAQQLGLLQGQKIGILEQSCFPEENTDIETDLAAVGIGGNQLSKYNYGCSTNVVSASSPDQDRAAVLQFQSAHVTLVLQTARAIVQNFAHAAQMQSYSTRYVMMNDQSMALIAGSSSPIPTNMNGTISITTDAEGETNTPGWHIDPVTAACRQIMVGLGLATPDDQHRVEGQLDGDGCAIVGMLVAALDHAPTLSRTMLAQGLALAGPLALAYPIGPTDITNPNDPTGGQSWRAAQWYTGCACWKVTDLTWRKGWI